MKWYTGIGSRKTPFAVLQAMTAVANKLEEYGFILRSGGARGADKAFENGTGNSQIFHTDGTDGIPYHAGVWSDAMDIAFNFHPAWHRCNDYVKKLHTRNVFQVLGAELDDPSKFVICWTPDGAQFTGETSRETGGTGMAIRIANHFGVPVFNLADSSTTARIERWYQLEE